MSLTPEQRKMDEWARIAQACSGKIQCTEHALLNNGVPASEFDVRVITNQLFNMITAIEKMEELNQPMVLSLAAVPTRVRFNVESTASFIAGLQLNAFLVALAGAPIPFEEPRRTA